MKILIWHTNDRGPRLVDKFVATSYTQETLKEGVMQFTFENGYQLDAADEPGRVRKVTYFLHSVLKVQEMEAPGDEAVEAQ